MISIKNFTFSFGDKVIFDNLNLNIDENWKTGLIGRNGRGKTTLLNILAGKYGCFEEIFSTVKFTLFPYEVKDADKTVLEIFNEVCPAAEDWEIMRELSYLDIGAETPYTNFNNLSCGGQTKVLLAALFLNDGNFLLIDEPTNHLDEEGRRTVAKYLNRKKGFILVSHDRSFLDGCTDHTVAVNRTGIETVNGNFSVWFKEFEIKQAAEEAKTERLKKETARLKQTAERTARWADKVEASKIGAADKGYVGHKSAKMMKRAKTVEARREDALEEKRSLLKDAEYAKELKISPIEFRADRLATFNSVEIYYGGKKICAPVDLEILRGDRIALHGKNGCGKSSLLKILTGERIEYTGAVKTAAGLKISYVPQKAALPQVSLFDYAAQNEIDGQRFIATLSYMGFENKDFSGDISAFSEGQKKKIMLAKSLCESAHLYVWDEPLNYLDVYSRMQIENLINQYRPAMIFVEHDAAFVNSVATKIYKGLQNR